MKHKIQFTLFWNTWKDYNWTNKLEIIENLQLMKQNKFLKDFYVVSVILLQKESSIETLNQKILCSEKKIHSNLLFAILDSQHQLTNKNIFLFVVEHQDSSLLRLLISKTFLWKVSQLVMYFQLE